MSGCIGAAVANPTGTDAYHHTLDLLGQGLHKLLGKNKLLGNLKARWMALSGLIPYAWPGPIIRIHPYTDSPCLTRSACNTCAWNLTPALCPSPGPPHVHRSVEGASSGYQPCNWPALLYIPEPLECSCTHLPARRGPGWTVQVWVLNVQACVQCAAASLWKRHKQSH